jgi:hypothetical protein
VELIDAKVGSEDVVIISDNFSVNVNHSPCCKVRELHDQVHAFGLADVDDRVIFRA